MPQLQECTTVTTERHHSLLDSLDRYVVLAFFLALFAAILVLLIIVMYVRYYTSKEKNRQQRNAAMHLRRPLPEECYSESDDSDFSWIDGSIGTAPHDNMTDSESVHEGILKPNALSTNYVTDFSDDAFGEEQCAAKVDISSALLLHKKLFEEMPTMALLSFTDSSILNDIEKFFHVLLHHPNDQQKRTSLVFTCCPYAYNTTAPFQILIRLLVELKHDAAFQLMLFVLDWSKCSYAVSEMAVNHLQAQIDQKLTHEENMSVECGIELLNTIDEVVASFFSELLSTAAATLCDDETSASRENVFLDLEQVCLEATQWLSAVQLTFLKSLVKSLEVVLQYVNKRAQCIMGCENEMSLSVEVMRQREHLVHIHVSELIEEKKKSADVFRLRLSIQNYRDYLSDIFRKSHCSLADQFNSLRTILCAGRDDKISRLREIHATEIDTLRKKIIRNSGKVSPAKQLSAFTDFLAELLESHYMQRLGLLDSLDEEEMFEIQAFMSQLVKSCMADITQYEENMFSNMIEQSYATEEQVLLMAKNVKADLKVFKEQLRKDCLSQMANHLQIIEKRNDMLHVLVERLIIMISMNFQHCCHYIQSVIDNSSMLDALQKSNANICVKDKLSSFIFVVAFVTVSHAIAYFKSKLCETPLDDTETGRETFVSHFGRAMESLSNRCQTLSEPLFQFSCDCREDISDSIVDAACVELGNRLQKSYCPLISSTILPFSQKEVHTQLGHSTYQASQKYMELCDNLRKSVDAVIKANESPQKSAKLGKTYSKQCSDKIVCMFESELRLANEKSRIFESKLTEGELKVECKDRSTSSSIFQEVFDVLEDSKLKHSCSQRIAEADSAYHKQYTLESLCTKLTLRSTSASSDLSTLNKDELKNMPDSGKSKKKLHGLKRASVAPSRASNAKKRSDSTK